MNICGTCLYGNDKHRYGEGKVQCMIEGYTIHNLTYCCNKYKRNFKKAVVTTKNEVKNIEC